MGRAEHERRAHLQLEADVSEEGGEDDAHAGQQQGDDHEDGREDEADDDNGLRRGGCRCLRQRMPQMFT